MAFAPWAKTPQAGGLGVLCPQAGYCQQRQPLGLEKSGAVCVRGRNSGETSSSRVLPAKPPGAQFTPGRGVAGLEGLLALLTRAVGLSCMGLRGGAIAFGPENKSSELHDVRLWRNRVVAG